MPRTQTNDPVPALAPLVFRFAATNVSASGIHLFTNDISNNLKVITCMDVVSLNSGEGNYIAIGVTGEAIPGTVAIFGGMTGAGFYDTFSWRGQFCLNPGEVLVAYDVAGNWSISAAGYQAIIPLVG